MLEGYTYFVEKVRTYRKEDRGLEEAVDLAIEDCIKNHVLEDFFRDRKDEVKKMTHLDYTWEKREQMIRKEEFEDGMERGIAQGIERGMERGIEQGIAQGMERGVAEGIQRGAEQEKRNTAARMVKLQIPMEQIAQAVGESVETVEGWLKEA